MTSSYSVQNSMVRNTSGLHIKSRILKIKPYIHTITFYQNWLKRFGDDSVFLSDCNHSLVNSLLHYSWKFELSWCAMVKV